MMFWYLINKSLISNIKKNRNLIYINFHTCVEIFLCFSIEIYIYKVVHKWNTNMFYLKAKYILPLNKVVKKS